MGLSSLLPAAQAPDWPQFRGPDRDNISKETGLLRRWPAGGPKVLWSVPVAQGYAGAAIVGGRVYHHDYDEAKSEWMRQLPVSRRRQADLAIPGKPRYPSQPRDYTHGAGGGRQVRLFRWTPSACCTAWTPRPAKQIWRKSLVTEYKSTIPSWYNGQCPLLEADRIIIGTGGAAIMVALDKATGKEIWRTPNPGNTCCRTFP